MIDQDIPREERVGLQIERELTWSLVKFLAFAVLAYSFFRWQLVAFKYPSIDMGLLYNVIEYILVAIPWGWSLVMVTLISTAVYNASSRVVSLDNREHSIPDTYSTISGSLALLLLLESMQHYRIKCVVGVYFGFGCLYVLLSLILGICIVLWDSDLASCGRLGAQYFIGDGLPKWVLYFFLLFTFVIVTRWTIVNWMNELRKRQLDKQKGATQFLWIWTLLCIPGAIVSYICNRAQFWIIDQLHTKLNGMEPAQALALFTICIGLPSSIWLASKKLFGAMQILEQRLGHYRGRYSGQQQGIPNAESELKDFGNHTLR